MWTDAERVDARKAVEGMDRIAMRRALRAEFLRRLYDRVDGSVSEFVNGYELTSAMGLDRSEAARLFAYFEEKGEIRVDDHREGTLRLTSDGVDRVEADAVGG